MADVKVIGRVAIRVMPDLSDFHRDLAKDLKREEERADPIKIKAELDLKGLVRDLKNALRDLDFTARTNPVELQAELDAQHVDREARDLVREVRRELKRNLGAINVETKLKMPKSPLDHLQADRAIKQADKALDAFGNDLEARANQIVDLKSEMRETMREIGRMTRDFEMGVHLDTDGLADEVDELIAGMNGDIRLDMEILGMNKAQREVFTLRRELDGLMAKLEIEGLSREERDKILVQVADLKEKIQDKLEGIEAQVAPQTDEAFYRRVQSRMAWLARTRFVTFVPQISKTAAAEVATALAALSGARGVADLVDNLWDLFKNLDKNIPKIGLMGEGIAGVSGWALSASANLFALSANLAAIGPAALALPGILSGITIGLGVTVVALLDINKVIPDVIKRWGTLRKTISDNFWSQAAKPLREMTQRIMPDFERGMAKAAVQMGRFVGIFTNDLSKELKGNPLAAMFQDLQDSVSILTDGTEYFARSIRILGEQGAKQLPRLADWFVTINRQFANFLTVNDKNGNLKLWIDNGVQALKDLGEVIKQTARLLSGLADAAQAAGGTSLASLAKNLQGIADVVHSPGFQTILIDVLLAAERAMGNISRVAGPAVQQFFENLGKTLTTVLPAVGSAIGTLLSSVASALSGVEFQSGMVSMFRDLETAITTLSPAIVALGPALGKVMQLIGTMAISFAPLLGTALETIVDIFIALAPAITVAVRALSGGLLTVIQALAPVLVQLAKSLSPVIEKLGHGMGAALRRSAPVIAKIAGVLGGALVASLDVVADSLPEIVDSLLPQLLEVAKQIAPQLPELVKGFLGLVKAVVETDLITRLGELTGSLLELVTSDILPQLIRDLPSLATSLGELAMALTSISDAAGALNVFQGIWTVLKALNGIIQVFNPSRILLDIVNGFRQGLNSGDWNKFWLDFALAPVRIVKKALGIASPSKVFIAIGRWVIEGFAKGLSVLESIFAAADKIKDAVVGKFVNAKDFLVGRGRDLVSGITRGIGERLGAVRTKAGEILARAKDGVKGAGEKLKLAGSSLISGFLTGIRNRFNDVRNLLNRLTALLPDWKGPANTDKVILRNAGELVMGGFLKGLESQYGAIKDSLTSFSDELGDTDFAITPTVEADIATTNAKKAAKAAVTGDELVTAQQAQRIIDLSGMTVNNPVGVPTEESINSELQLATIMDGA